MENIVYVKNYEPPEVDIKDIMRYSRIAKLMPELEDLISECILEASNKLSYKVCYSEFPIWVGGDVVDFGFAKVKSEKLAKNLENCSRAVVFAATIGIEIDRLIKKYTVLSPSRSIIFHAIGAERVESLCNAFNSEIDLEFTSTMPRYSPGYGDFSLEFQREIFKALNCPKNIGVSLTEDCLMTPSKSVTAVIGIKKP